MQNKNTPTHVGAFSFFECFSSFVYVVIPIENRFNEGKGRDKIDLNQIFVLLWAKKLRKRLQKT